MSYFDQRSTLLGLNLGSSLLGINALVSLVRTYAEDVDSKVVSTGGVCGVCVMEVDTFEMNMKVGAQEISKGILIMLETIDEDLDGIINP